MRISWTTFIYLQSTNSNSSPDHIGNLLKARILHYPMSYTIRKVFSLKFETLTEVSLQKRFQGNHSSEVNIIFRCKNTHLVALLDTGILLFPLIFRDASKLSSNNLYHILKGIDYLCMWFHWAPWFSFNRSLLMQLFINSKVRNSRNF